MKNHFSNEKPFIDFPELLDLQELNGLDVWKDYKTDRAAAVFVDFIAESMKLPLKECLMKAKYYSFLQDGSTDTSVSEQELICLVSLQTSTRSDIFEHWKSTNGRCSTPWVVRNRLIWPNFIKSHSFTQNPISIYAHFLPLFFSTKNSPL